MRILIAVHHFPPTFGGGAEWRAYRTARGLRQAGHQVRVVCVESIKHGDGGRLEDVVTACDGIDVHRLHFSLAKSPDPFLWSYRNPLVGDTVAGLVREFRPDVLHLIGGYLMSGSTIEAAQTAAVPVVLTLTDFWFLCPRITLVRSDSSLCASPADSAACALCLCKERRRYRLLDVYSGGMLGRALSRAWSLPLPLFENGAARLAALRERRAYLLSLLSATDVVISPSHFLKEVFEAQGVSPRRFLYMQQGLDTSSWAAAERVSPDSLMRIGYIGQLARHKGVNVLVEAFHYLRARGRTPQLMLYGDPDQFPRFVRRLRKQAGERQDIVFAGRFEHSQIRRIHAHLDVLVVPSVWYENSPNVILEAFAAGTPVVVSRLGGMAEMVTDGVNGFQFEAGNARDLARVLQRLVDQPDLAATLGRSSPPVKTVQQEIEELVEVYTGLTPRPVSRGLEVE